MKSIKKVIMFLLNLIIPKTDVEFDSYQDRVTTYLSANKLRLGLNSADVTTLLGYQTTWNTQFPKVKDPAQRTPALVDEKTALRFVYELLLRKVIAQAKVSVNLTPTDRSELSLPDPNEPRTPIGKPKVAPVLSLNSINHLVHVLRFRDPENPTMRKRPFGVAYVEVFAFEGANPPTDESLYRSIGKTGRFLFSITYTTADVGKTIWYVARYNSTRSEQGSLSEPVTGVVA